MGGPAGLSFLSCSKNLSSPDSVTPKHLGRVGHTALYLFLHKLYQTVRRVGLTTIPLNLPPDAWGAGLLITHTCSRPSLVGWVEMGNLAPIFPVM